jgi:hypothetical protein
VRIDAARRRAWGSNFTPSGFVFFRSQQAAAMAASTQIYGEDGAKFQARRSGGPLAGRARAFQNPQQGRGCGGRTSAPACRPPARGRRRTRAQVRPAPGPEEVNWQHLWLTWRQRDVRSALLWPLMVLVVVFPVTLITSYVAQLQFVLCPTTAAVGSKVRGPRQGPCRRRGERPLCPPAPPRPGRVR